MAYNAAQRKDVTKAEKAAKLAEQNRREVVTQIMSTANGREWIWNRLALAGIFTVSAPLDALQMAFREGERNQGISLLDDVMQSCPDEFILAQRENNARRTADNASASSSGERASSENGDGRDQEPTNYVHDDDGRLDPDQVGADLRY